NSSLCAVFRTVQNLSLSVARPRFVVALASGAAHTYRSYGAQLRCFVGAFHLNWYAFIQLRAISRWAATRLILPWHTSVWRRCSSWSFWMEFQGKAQDACGQSARSAT